MKIGIVGSDERAMAIGRLLCSGGHEVSFGDPCAKDRAQRAAAALGAQARLPYEQAMCSDLLLFAVPRPQLDRVVTAIGSGVSAVVVDAIEAERGDGSRSGAETLAQKLDSHNVVRALINMPHRGANVQICGDDLHAKELVDQAFQACGCLTTDRGPLAHSSELEAPAIAA